MGCANGGGGMGGRRRRMCRGDFLYDNVGNSINELNFWEPELGFLPPFVSYEGMIRHCFDCLDECQVYPKASPHAVCVKQRLI